jgi:cytochrome c peroxidase
MLALSCGLTLASAHAAPGGLGPAEQDYELKIFGKFVFFDNLSIPPRMSCATCHEPKTGGTGNNSLVNATQVAITGANPHTVGSLRPPTNTYATFIDTFKNRGRGGGPPRGTLPGNGVPPRGEGFCGGGTGFCGGNFWNGRAVGVYGDSYPGSTTVIDNSIIPLQRLADYEKYLGPTADQALNPFPNPVEQNIPIETVCRRVQLSAYSILFTIAWGEPIRCGTAEEVDVSYKRIAVSLAAYQASSEVNSFSSKRDRALAEDPDGAFPLEGFTEQENRGHDLFYGVPSDLNPAGKNALCTECHLSRIDAPFGDHPLERYADDAYHNIGTPKNWELTNPEAAPEGLHGHIQVLDGRGRPVGLGFRKTPTLRNVDKRPYPSFVKAYGANGWFKSLWSIVHFYNTAAIGRPTAESYGITRCPEEIKTEAEALAANCWPAPEFGGAPLGAFIGDLGLTYEEEMAIVAYMQTFTDEVTARQPTLWDLLQAVLTHLRSNGE